MSGSFLDIKYLNSYQTNQVSQQLKQILKCSSTSEKMKTSFREAFHEVHVRFGIQSMRNI